MKKGISLIVLVITIIVMIIIAGAIIISLNSTNVIAKAEEAVAESDLANAKYAVSLVYADILVANNDSNPSNDYTEATAKTAYETALGADAAKFIVAVDANMRPTVTAKPTASN